MTSENSDNTSSEASTNSEPTQAPLPHSADHPGGPAPGSGVPLRPETVFITARSGRLALGAAVITAAALCLGFGLGRMSAGPQLHKCADSPPPAGARSFPVPSRSLRMPCAPSHAAWLGVVIEDWESGAMISDIFDSSPASRSSLNVGEVILKVNGIKISDADHLTRVIRKLTPNHKATFVVRAKDGNERVEMIQLERIHRGLGARAGGLLRRY